MEQVWLSAEPIRSTMALQLAEELIERYELSAISSLLATAESAAAQDDITVAVLGRFKAGKSSFLNNVFCRDILPVGVVPVTAVVTEVRFGERERARVFYNDGATREIPVENIGEYVAEKQNPENVKQAELIAIELPELRRLPGLRFVDTPGLQSALAHNSQAVLDWLPNVGLALIAIGVDPPLSQRDIDLLKILYRYTPKVAVLLTKADLLRGPELVEVVEFVRTQLSKNLTETPPIFPYSTQPGFERFQKALETTLLAVTPETRERERKSIMARKADTVLRECGEYLTLSLKAAQTARSERHAVKQKVIGEKEALDEVKAHVHLAVRYTVARTRGVVNDHLEKYQAVLEAALTNDFARLFPGWTSSLREMLTCFEEWLASALRGELGDLSIRERGVLIEPLHKVQQQVLRTLQQFRDRLSEQTIRTFGVPLRTAETEVSVAQPATPNIRVGRVFDRNWELLSAVLPVWAIRSLVQQHFLRTIGWALEQNISRLSSQWEECVNAALWKVEKEASRRLDELVATAERMIENACDDRVPDLRTDLERIDNARRSLSQ